MQSLDQTLLKRACDRIAARYSQDDFLCAEVRQRLLERLDLMRMEPAVVLDLGGATGAGLTELQMRWPDALHINLDWSEAMLAIPREGAQLCADGHRIPLADNSVDIVVSNLMLPGCDNPEQVFAEVHRVLRSPGLFLFSSLGPDTLKELRFAWSRVDSRVHIHPFADMHNIGDVLVQTGFSEPVMDVEMLTVTYSEVRSLVRDLRAVAATNLAAERSRGLTTPRHWARRSRRCSPPGLTCIACAIRRAGGSRRA